MRTRIVIGVSLTVVVLAMANLLPSQAQKAASMPAQAQVGPMAEAPILDQGARLNPLKIGLLNWYMADIATFVAVSGQPYGLCFDGANIWSADFAGNTVTKVRANDGEVLGTFKVGTQPYGVTFDGANVW